MPTIPFIQPSFAAGELSPFLYGRVDLAKYHVGCRTLLNFFVHPHGGASNRPGTLFVGGVDGDTVRHRLIPFQFRTAPAGQSYALVFGDMTMQVVMNGGFVLDGGGDIYTLATPYAVADLPTLKFVQSADTMTLTHPSYAPRNLTRTGHAAWMLTILVFAPKTLAPVGLSSGSPGSGADYVVTAVDDTTGEESLQSATCSSNVTNSSLSWTPVANCSNYNIYRSRNGLFGFIGSAGITAGVGQFVDTNVLPDVSNCPPGARNPFAAAGDWPACSTYYMQRQVFGGTGNNPQTLVFSGTGTFNNMNVSQPTKDDDAITRTLVSRQVNEIRHFVPGTSMLVMTSGAEWRCYPGTTANALTPAACATLPQTAYGSSHTPPLQIGYNILFIQERGSRVREMAYDALRDNYIATDLSVLASHLFSDTAAQYDIQEWAFAQEPFQIAWGVRSDGLLLGFTYMKEHDVYAWHRHATDGVVESVCTVAEGREDAVYLIVARQIAQGGGGNVTRRYVERMASRTFGSITDAWFVDCGLQYSGTNTTPIQTLTIRGPRYDAGDTVSLIASNFVPFSPMIIGQTFTLRAGGNAVSVTVTAYQDPDNCFATLLGAADASLQDQLLPDWSGPVTAVSGLDHLEGKTVAILGDGSVVPSQVVRGGTVQLDGPYSKVIVGLPYHADLETLNLELPGTGGTLQGQMKKIAQVTVRVKDARGIKVGIAQSVSGGASGPTTTEVKQRQVETLGTPMQPFTGDFAVVIPTEWNRDGRLFVRQEYPLPCTITDLIPEVNAGD
jgi:hypothetical protein